MRHTPTRNAKGKIPQGRRRTREEDNDIPEIYLEMLAESEARSPISVESDKPAKRRKVGERTAASVGAETRYQGIQTREDKNDNRQLQTVYDLDTPSEESDIEWEDIDLQQSPLDSREAPISKLDDEPLQITLGTPDRDKKKIASRQKPLSAAEKKLRLDIHKVHLLCLLRHVYLRNLWCNDPLLQDQLKPMLSRHIISLLNPPESQDKFARSRTFMDGLNQAGDVFGKKFKVTCPGIKRAHWAHNLESLKDKSESIISNTEVFLSIDDYRKQAKRLSGSRDFGAQLFCALLRSVAVEARLVCSLQPLPFSAAVKNMSPAKPKSFYTTIASYSHASSGNETSSAGASSSTPRSATRRLGQPRFPPSRPSTTLLMDPFSKPPESSYPVFWVEAFNEGAQKWIVVDPLVTKSLAKPHKLEPPASDYLNNLSYVVAFDEDTTARDVTQRYARAYNAKTRKLRVESTKGGELWWKKVIDVYEKPYMTDRDAMEITDLTSKAATEPMPRNIQDFKDHPVYALERLLRRNEVIHPKRVIGHVAVGKIGSKTEGQEPVYRRSDVHVVRSADKWYRLGRDIKMGEQPLKHVPAQASKNAGTSMDDENDLFGAETPLYAEYQTELYKAPPVVGGMVPRNVYGNLDIYTPNMVPPGGVHIKRPDAELAAKILAIDYAPAVTGFDFKGRHGTAVFNGIVIASEHQAAVELVMEGLEDERRLSELAAKSAQALRLWKHFLLKLRIIERVKGYTVEGDVEPDVDMSDQNSELPDDAGGGFLHESDQERTDPFLRIRQQTDDQDHSPPGGPSDSSNAQDELLSGGFIPDESTETTEPAGHMKLDREHTAGTAAQYVHHSSHYTLVVVPNGEVTKDESNVPRYLRPTEAEQSTAVYREQQTASPEGNTSRELENSSGTSDSKEPAAGDSDNSSAPVHSHAEPQAGSPMNIQEPSDKGSESDYQGSMLSEDPEDVDSFPEWLL